jgi:hypothetical protein
LYYQSITLTGRVKRKKEKNLRASSHRLASLPLAITQGLADIAYDRFHARTLPSPCYRLVTALSFFDDAERAKVGA